MCPHFFGITPLVLPHGADHVDGVAIAGIGVGDHRDLDRVHDPPSVVNHLRQGHQSDVGASQPGSRAPEAGHVGGGKPRLLHQPCPQRVEAARSQHHLIAVEQSAQ
jgi:hypothetical protein